MFNGRYVLCHLHQINSGDTLFVLKTLISTMVYIMSDTNQLLCVSCPSANEFYFYFLPDQAQTRLDHLKVLDELWCKISFKSDNG